MSGGPAEPGAAFIHPFLFPIIRCCLWVESGTLLGRKVDRAAEIVIMTPPPPGSGTGTRPLATLGSILYLPVASVSVATAFGQKKPFQSALFPSQYVAGEIGTRDVINNKWTGSTSDSSTTGGSYRRAESSRRRVSPLFNSADRPLKSELWDGVRNTSKQETTASRISVEGDPGRVPHQNFPF